MIDLAEESGVVKHMNERPPEQFASEYLEYRRTYILVDVKRECLKDIQCKNLKTSNEDIVAVPQNIMRINCGIRLE